MSAVFADSFHFLALLNADDRGAFGRVIRRRYRLVGPIPQNARVRIITGGAVVNLDPLWERLSLDGWPVSAPPR